MYRTRNNLGASGVGSQNPCIPVWAHPVSAIWLFDSVSKMSPWEPCLTRTTDYYAPAPEVVPSRLLLDRPFHCPDTSVHKWPPGSQALSRLGKFRSTVHLSSTLPPIALSASICFLAGSRNRRFVFSVDLITADLSSFSALRAASKYLHPSS